MHPVHTHSLSQFQHENLLSTRSVGASKPLWFVSRILRSEVAIVKSVLRLSQATSLLSQHALTLIYIYIYIFLLRYACEYHRCYANKIPAEQHVQRWVLFISSNGQIFLFVISLQPSVMSCPSEGDPGWLSISPGSSKGAKTDAEGKNAEGDLNGGMVSTVLAQLTFLQVGVWDSAVDLTALTVGVENVPPAGGCNEVAAWAYTSFTRRVVSGAIADARMMATILKVVVRITKALKHKKVGSWHLSNLEEDMFRWRRGMNPHPPLRSVRRPLQWCVSIGLSKLCLTG